jgi:DNA-binding phage protein
MRRAKTYNQLVAETLKSRKAVQEYLLGLMEDEDELSAEDALKIVISHMGITEFSEMARLQRTNVNAFVTGKRKLKPETLETYLKPFGIRARLIFEKAS